MVRLSSILAIAVFVLVARAQEIISPGPIMRTMASTACATTDTSIPHDTLLEGFQTATTGYENTWAQVGTTANITAAADSSALTTGKPTGACSQAWKLIVPTDGTETYARWDNGSAIDIDTQALDIVFYLYIETGPDAGENFIVFYAGLTTNPGTTPTCYVTLNNNAGQLQLRGTASSNTTYSNVSAGTWVKVSLHLDTATAGSTSTFAVDNEVAKGFNRYAADVRYISIGAPLLLDANDSGTLWFDLICANTP